MDLLSYTPGILCSESGQMLMLGHDRMYEFLRL